MTVQIPNKHITLLGILSNTDTLWTSQDDQNMEVAVLNLTPLKQACDTRLRYVNNFTQVFKSSAVGVVTRQQQLDF